MGIDKIRPIDLTLTVREALDGYSAQVREGVAQAVEAAGKQALRDVRARSPVKTGAYKKGWRLKKSRGGVQGDQPSVVVYNAERGYLTHLLENGHQKTNGGRVEGIPHIRPAYQAAERTLEADVRRIIQEAGDDI